jgi:septum formation topological specificity factor MinE
MSTQKQTFQVLPNQLHKLNDVILKVVESYQKLDREKVQKLIEQTDKIGGCSFISINGYSSDKSQNTEVAFQLINIGANYNNMLEKDKGIFEKLTEKNVKNAIDVNKFDYTTIDKNGLTLKKYKSAVKKALPEALEELKAPKAKKDTSADIWFNKALVFNLNTMRLSIFGQTVNKVVEVKGEFKPVKSAPKTIAKKLIELQSKGKTQTLRRFALDNLIGNIAINKDTLELK